MQNQTSDQVTNINVADNAQASTIQSPTSQEILSGEPPINPAQDQIAPEEMVQKIETQEPLTNIQASEPSLNSELSLNIENAFDADAEPIPTSEPAQEAQVPPLMTDFNQVTEPTQIIEEPAQVATPIQDETQANNELNNNVDLDLKLDPDLIDNNQVNSTLPNEPVNIEESIQTPDFNQNLGQDLNQESVSPQAQEVNLNTNIAQDQNPVQNSFAEEIAPLQNQFEQQTTENTNQ